MMLSRDPRMVMPEWACPNCLPIGGCRGGEGATALRSVATCPARTSNMNSSNEPASACADRGADGTVTEAVPQVGADRGRYTRVGAPQNLGQLATSHQPPSRRSAFAKIVSPTSSVMRLSHILTAMSSPFGWEPGKGANSPRLSLAHRDLLKPIQIWTWP